MGLLDGKVAIITGAGGGLGEAYAKLFAREGAAVVVNDLGGPRDGSGADVSMAQKVVNAIKEEGGRAVANGSDISTIAGGQSVFEDAIKNFGRADILVNNAGILLDETFAKAKEANWDKVIRVHLKGTFCCTQPVFKWMRENGEKLATLVASRFARGDGGFGGPSEGQPEPHKVPGRAPDKIVDITTRPDQALVYRLCGDRNPLHSDPEFAKRAGFPKPILHGMCTYGITCRGILQTYADYDPNAFKQHAARFSSPVYPGETVTMELWKDGNVISFEAKVKARGVTVIKSGKTVLG